MINPVVLIAVAVTLFVAGVGVVLVNGCSPAEFQKDHPIAAEVIEEVVELGENIAEQYAEHELGLPERSLSPVFKHKLFTPLPQPIVPVSPFTEPPRVNAPVEAEYVIERDTSSSDGDSLPDLR